LLQIIKDYPAAPAPARHASPAPVASWFPTIQGRSQDFISTEAKGQRGRHVATGGGSNGGKGHMAEARAYNGGLGAEPRWGSGSKVPWSWKLL